MPWWGSRLLQEVIPFNRPHRLTVHVLGEFEAEVRLPFLRRNKNHLGTMHACAMATAAEYASGLCVLRVIGMEGYRLVMSEMNVQYTRRAEGACTAKACIDLEEREALMRGLEAEGKHGIVLVSKVVDYSGTLVAEARVHWHVKRLDASKLRTAFA